MSNGTDRYGRDYDDPEYGNYGIEPGRGGSSSSNSGNRRGARFVEALEKANQYKQGIYEKAKIEKKVKDEDDDKKSSRNAFSISSDTTVRPGYEDPGFTLAGVQGRSLLGPLGAGISVFNPALGRGVSAVGGLTGL